MKIKECNNFFDNFKGLMFQKNFDYGLKIKCNGIHTFFMFESIDVVLTDKDGYILYIYHNLKPNRIILPKKNVCYTYEFPSGYVDNLEVGGVFDPK